MARNLEYEGHLATLQFPFKLTHQDGSPKTAPDVLFSRPQNDEVNPRRELEETLSALVQLAFNSAKVDAQSVRFRKDSSDALVGIAAVEQVQMDPADFLVGLRDSAKGAGSAVSDYLYGS